MANLTADQRQEIIDDLLEAETFTESEALETLTDNQLVALVNPEALDTLVANSVKEEEEEEEDGNPPKTKPTDNKGKKGGCKELKTYSDDELTEEYNSRMEAKKKKGKKVTGNQNTPCDQEELSAEDWLKSAPPQIRNVVTNAINREAEQRAELVSKIQASENNVMSEDELESMTINQLVGISKLCTPPTKEVTSETEVSRVFPNFSGKLPSKPTGNSKVTALEPIDIDYSTIKF